MRDEARRRTQTASRGETANAPVASSPDLRVSASPHLPSPFSPSPSLPFRPQGASVRTATRLATGTLLCRTVTATCLAPVSVEAASWALLAATQATVTLRYHPVR